MPSEPAPADELDRLRALRRLQILDTPAEGVFDDIVALAAELCGTSISLLTLLDERRQWFKARHGLSDMTETPREQAFCDHAIRGTTLMEVTDAARDPRFAGNPLITGYPHIRFYAGVPLALKSGHRVGTLCVIDREPRTLTPPQRRELAALARVAAHLLEGDRSQRDLARTGADLLGLYEQTPGMLHVTDGARRILFVSDRWLDVLGWTRGQVEGRDLLEFLSDDSRPAYAQRLAEREEGRLEDLFVQMLTGRGEALEVRFRSARQRDGRVITCVEDVSPRTAAEAAMAAQRRALANVIEAMGVATWEWDIAADRVQANERWAGLIGYRLDELEPISLDVFTSLIHPDDVDEVTRRLTRHLDGEADTYEVELRMRHRDGHWKWLLTRGRVLERDAQGRPLKMFGAHLDIDERKRQEVQLRRSQELLEATGRVAGVGGWELDPATGRVQWTKQTQRIFGVGDDYAPTLEGAIRFYPGDARPLIENAVAEARATGRGWDLEVPFVRASGERIWVRVQGSVEMQDGEVTRLYGAFQDITQRRRLSDELEQRSELLHVTLESIGDAVITTDAHGAITWMNPAAEHLTGVTREAVQGRRVAAVFGFVSASTGLPLADPVDECLRRHEVYTLGADALLLTHDGRERAVEDSVAPIQDRDGRTIGAVMVFRDVTEQRRLEEEMNYRATHDPLTGLVNRAEFELRLTQMLGSSREQGVEHVLLYLDLDSFKGVNDTCGHTAGDELLVQVAAVFRRTVRAQDTVARLGGDEFAIILERCTEEAGRRIAETICKRVREFRFVHERHTFQIGVSIGLARVHQGWGSVSLLMQAADSACYAAKEAGRNCVRTHADDGTLRLQDGRRLRWAERIEDALGHDRLQLHAQHIQGAARNEGGGACLELLLRMQDGDGGVLLPQAFLPAAERYRLLGRIDRWVFERALHVLQQASTEQVSLFVKVSSASLGDHAFHEFVMGHLERTAAPVRRRLGVQIAERAVMANLPEARHFLVACRTFGVRTVLEDFGGAMASLRFLRDLDLDFVKIHGPLVSSLLDDPLSEVAVKMAVEVARKLDVTAIAPHVESAEILAAVTELGVTVVQGQFLHRPAPLADVLATGAGGGGAGREVRDARSA